MALNPIDLRVDTYSTGSKGFSLRSEVAIRITHIPTGIVAECSKYRSQHLNREEALGMLEIKLKETKIPSGPQAIAAVKTLEYLGYTYHGAEFWKPPVKPLEPKKTDGTYHLGACISDGMLYITVMGKEHSGSDAVTVLLSEQISIEQLQKNDVMVSASQQPAPSEPQPFGWIKQSEIDSSNDFGGSINLWRRKYDCDVPVYLAQQPAPSAADTTTVPEGWTDADADAARLALELECLLTDTKDQAVVSKWWASAHDALELHRARLASPQPSPTPHQNQKNLCLLDEFEKVLDTLRSWNNEDDLVWIQYREPILRTAIAQARTAAQIPADSVTAPQGETNAQLDIDSNHSAPGQQRDVAGSVALGQPVGNGSDQAAGHTGAQGDKLLIVAERNIRSFLRSAVFKSESDREAALNCVDVLWEAASAPESSVTASAQQGKWTWVPVEPSTAMLVAGNHGQPGNFSALKVWQDMLGALERSFDYTRPIDPPSAAAQMLTYGHECQDAEASREMVGEPVFAFRRKGLNDFCTCTEEHYEELSAKPNLFEVRVFYTAPPPQAVREPLPTDVELMKTISKAVRGLTMHRNGTTSIRIAKAVLEEYGYLYPPPKKDAETL